MMEAAVLYALNKRVEDEEEEDDDLGCPSSSSSSSSSLGSTNSNASSSSDFMDDATSSSASSSRNEPEESSPLFEMAALMEDLPIKKGLSRHFEGKSQSFTSLANARCLEDLAKPVRGCKRKGTMMKACRRSYGGGMEAHKAPLSPKKEGIAKKPSRASSLASLVRRSSAFAVTGRPPVHPHASSGVGLSSHSQALLFA